MPNILKKDAASCIAVHTKVNIIDVESSNSVSFVFSPNLKQNNSISLEFMKRKKNLKVFQN